MPYVNRNGNKWVCWSCLNHNCGLCINTVIKTTDEMRTCVCVHPDEPQSGLLPDQKREQMTTPVVTDHHTGPVPIIREGRGYATPFHIRRRAS